MLITERGFAPKLKVIWIEHHVTWLLLLRLLQCSSHLSFIHAHKLIMSFIMSSSHTYSYIRHVILPLVHTWNSLVHIHAIGVSRIVVQAKLRKAWTPKLESIWEPEVQSDEPGANAGAVHEAEPEAILIWLRQAPEHYKPPTFKAINYICYIYCCIKW
jgi:hypothetical protein